MFEKILTFLDEKGVPYTTNQKENIVTFLARMTNSSFHCIMELKESSSILVFYSTISAITPEEKKILIAELITRINYNLLIGNFEMDFDDGEIRYKTSIDYEGYDITNELLDNLIGANLSLIDDYFYTIIEAITSNKSAIELLEKKEIEDNSRLSEQ